MKVRFSELFFAEEANEDFIKRILPGRVYSATAAPRTSNYQYNIHVDGTTLTESPFGFYSWDGIIPAFAHEIELCGLSFWAE